MNSPAQQPSANQPEAQSPTTTEVKRPVSRRRRWARRGLWLLAVLVGLRIAFALALPSILERALDEYGLACEYESLDVSVFAMDVELWHFRLTTADRKQLYAESEYCLADLSALDLLTGRLVVRRLECDGIDLHLTRGVDGQISLLRHFATTAVSPHPDVADQESTSPNLEPPLEIQALRLQHAHLYFTDESFGDPLALRLDCHIRLSDFASALRPTRFALEVASPGVLPQLMVEGTSRFEQNAIRTQFEARLDALALEELSSYLNDLGIRAQGRSLSGGFKGSITLEENPALCASVEINDVQLAADDGAPIRLGVAKLVVGLDARGLRVHSALLDGGVVTLERASDGPWTCVGLGLAQGRSSGRSAASESVASPAGARKSTDVPNPFGLLQDLSEFAVTDCELRVVDHARGAHEPLGIRIDGFEVTARSDRSAATHDVLLRGAFPGLAGRVSLIGNCSLGESSGQYAFRGEADQLDGEALGPYLSDWGVELQLGEHEAFFEVDGSVAVGRGVEASATVGPARLVGPSGSAGLEEFSIRGVRIDPHERELEVRSIALHGVALEVVRDEDGSLRLPGVRYRVSSATGPTQIPKSDRALQPAKRGLKPNPSEPWSVHVAEVRLDGSGIGFSDAQARGTDAAFLFSRLGFEVDQFAWGRHGTGTEGSLRAYCEVPGVITNLDLSGDLLHSQNTTHFSGRFAGDDLSTHRILSYLPEGVVLDGWSSVFASAQVELQARAATETGFDFALRELSVEEKDTTRSDEPFLRCRAVGTKIALTPGGGLRVDELTVEAPVVTLVRTAKAVSLLGFALARQSTPVESASPSSSLLDFRLPDWPALDFAVTEAAFDAATVRWRDEPSALAGDVIADGALSGFRSGQTEPARFQARLRANQLFDALEVDGVLSAGVETQEVQVAAALRGMNRSSLNQLLPEGLGLDLEDGEFTGTLQARVERHPDGGHRLSTSVCDVRVRSNTADGGQLDVLALDEFRCEIARWDAATQVYVLDRLLTQGLRGVGRRQNDGTLTVAGVVLGSVAEVGQGGDSQPPATQPAAIQAPVSQVPVSEAPVAQAPTSRPYVRRQPRFEIRKLDLQLDEWVWLEPESHEPLRLVDGRIHLEEPWQVDLRSDDEAAKLPIDLLLRVEPIVQQIDTRVTLAPFADEPSVDVAVSIRGIDGPRFVQVIPDLQAMNPEPLGVASFDARFAARCTSPRRGPFDWDLNRALGAELKAEDLRLTDQDGEVAAGVKQVLVEGVSVNIPRRSVRVANVEIDTPIGRAVRDENGLEVAGVRLGVVATESSDLSGVEERPTASAPKVPAVERGSTWKVLVDQVALNGAEFALEDHTGAEVCQLGVRELGLGVQNISTGMADVPPLRFDLLVGVGSEERQPWFQELTATGQLEMGEVPVGKMRAQLGGLQLTHLAAPAEAAGVSIAEGTLDSRVDVHIVEGPEIHIDSESLFSNLDLQEPENGPIERFLKLPLSLQPVIFLLRDETGTIRVPVSLAMETDGVRIGELTRALASTLAQVIADAIASSPLRVAGAVTNLVGLSGDDRASRAVTTDVQFQSGDVTLSSTANGDLQQVIRALDEDPELTLTLSHEMGVKDLLVLEERVFPPASERQALLDSLRLRRLALEQQRAVEARAVLDATLVSVVQVADRRRESLTELDEELGEIEAAIDRLVDAGDDPAPHVRERRIRRSAVELARERLEQLESRVVSAGIAADRLRLVPPKSTDPPRSTWGRVELELEITQFSD